MKIWFTMIFFLGIIPLKGQTQRAMTYNIRYDTSNDGVNQWQLRKGDVAALLAFYAPHFIGVQEGLRHQLDYLDTCLTTHRYFGVGRDDGKFKGEYCAIFYDTTAYELLEQNTFWLSEKSSTVSKGWDAALERVCTYGLFEHLETKAKLWVFNTHFDHKGVVARIESAKLIIQKIQAVNLENYPVILMGDFNSIPESTPIQTLEEKLSNAARVSKKQPYGPTGTFNAFKVEAVMKEQIDFIFVQNLSVFSYRHIDDKRPNNLQVSDHLPVLITF